MTQIDRLLTDTIEAARVCGVSYSEPTIRRMLDVFHDGFSNGYVQFKTTTKSNDRRGLFFRAHTLEPGYTPLNEARAGGLLPAAGAERSDVDRVIPQVASVLPLMGGAADCDVQHGLAKIWQYLAKPHPISTLAGLSALPESVRDHGDFFERFRLPVFNIIGVDYQHESMNIYCPPVDASHGTRDFVRSLLGALGFEAPTGDVLGYCANAQVLAFTFRWDTLRIERMCFYVAGFFRGTIPPEAPLLPDWSRRLPSLTPNPIFILGWSFGERGAYSKMECGYQGDMMEGFARVMTAGAQG